MAGGGFFGGLAEGIKAGREQRQSRQDAAQKAAHQAFQEQLETRKLQLEQEKHNYQKEKDTSSSEFEREKFDYTKGKDTKKQDLNERKYQTEAEFKKSQEEHLRAQTMEISKKMTREQIEMQRAYFATWHSLSPQQQTEQAKKVLIENAHNSGMIDDKTHERLDKMDLPSFQLVARAGLGMSAKALELQKYAKPTQEKAPAGYQWKSGEGKELEPIPGGPAVKGVQVSAEKAKFNTQVAQGKSALEQLQTGFETGKYDSTTITAGSTPNFLNPIKSAPVQEFETLKMQAAEMFGRLQSGGAINKDEEKRFLLMLPSFGDKSETIQFKLKNAFKYYEEAQKSAGINSKTSTTAPSEGGMGKYQLPSGTVVDEATVIEKAKSLGIPPEEAINRLKAAGAKPLSMEDTPYQGAGELQNSPTLADSMGTPPNRPPMNPMRVMG